MVSISSNIEVTSLARYVEFESLPSTWTSDSGTSVIIPCKVTGATTKLWKGSVITDPSAYFQDTGNKTPYAIRCYISTLGCGYRTLLTRSGDITIEMVFKMDSTTPAETSVICSDRASSNITSSIFMRYAATTGAGQFYIYDDSGTLNGPISSVPSATTNWTHLIIRLKKSTKEFSVQVNGTKYSLTIAGNINNNPSNTLTLMSYNNVTSESSPIFTTSSTKGKLDYYRIWNSWLSDIQSQYLYNQWKYYSGGYLL